MGARGWWLVAMLAVLFLANLAMLMGLTNWPQQVREGFAAKVLAKKEKFSNMGGMNMGGMNVVGIPSGPATEGFMNYVGDGAPFATAPIGSYDGVNMAASMPASAQGFRGNHPDVPLAGPPIEVGPDNLFVFKNNECKPECCDSTLACDGGCVCTTPAQRDFINRRGGNSNGGAF
uniref:Uncharacterized protein n=1 Tax=viral metagenome TaxID=1070528 RepID=A0A6C0DD96_9ZZZZ